MRQYCAFAVLFVCSAVYCQSIHPLTQVEACRNFKRSIVGVSTDTMRGTGFIVGSDGWIITAFHVVADRETLIRYGNIKVSILGRSQSVDADIVSPIDKLASSRDFAILKVAKSDLPVLELGSESTAEDGSPVAIIGFPLSAAGVTASVPRFCLSGTVAAQTSLPLGNLEFLHTIYFQGVSIKGISGAPIISLINGKVIGVVVASLSGIEKSLEDVATHINGGNAGDIIMGPGPDMGVVGNLAKVITVLDTQLANGLGSGTGASDAVTALAKAKMTYHKEHAHQK